MNYLGHSYLTFGTGERLVGNLIGDFYKGRIEAADYPDTVKSGLHLHRMIDTYSDRHPACLRAKNIFRQDYRLYSGAIVDVIWDYFLANDPGAFPSSEALKLHSQNVYDQLALYDELIPEEARRMFGYMMSEDWLYDIRHLKGLKIALKRLTYRFSVPLTEEAAYELAVRHYYELNQMYFEFIDDIKEHLKFS